MYVEKIRRTTEDGIFSSSPLVYGALLFLKY